MIFKTLPLAVTLCKLAIVRFNGSLPARWERAVYGKVQLVRFM